MNDFIIVDSVSKFHPSMPGSRIPVSSQRKKTRNKALKVDPKLRNLRIVAPRMLTRTQRFTTKVRLYKQLASW